MEVDDESKAQISADTNSINPHTLSYHLFTPSQITDIQSSLLVWYDFHRRKLPWRGDASEEYGAAELKLREKTAATVTVEDESKGKRKPKKQVGKKESEENEDNEMTDAPISSAAASASSSSVTVAAAAAAAASSASSTSIIVPPISAYGIWVSEIMLQQTRVDAVISYWLRWMRRFPDIPTLASATLDEVNVFWAGLGYFRRAKYLLDGAKYIQTNHNGIMPRTIAELLKIPGIGPYSAGAIGSIAFGLQTPIVDGNVIRVLSRLRALDISPSHKLGVQAIWKLSADIVPQQRSGDFNQSMMELGATVCTPINAQCEKCPVRKVCYTYREVKQKRRPCILEQDERVVSASSVVAAPASSPIVDVEDLTGDVEITAAASSSSTSTSKSSKPKKTSTTNTDIFSSPSSACTLCSSSRTTPPDSVAAYPSKAMKKPPVEQQVEVWIVKRRHVDHDDADDGEERKENNDSADTQYKYLLFRRPATGLLAGQYEFPSRIISKSDATDNERKQEMLRFLTKQFNVDDETSSALNDSFTPLSSLGECTHIFSHRKHLMNVSIVEMDTEKLELNLKKKVCHDRVVKEEKGEEATTTTATNGKKRSRNTRDEATADKKKPKVSKSKKHKKGSDAEEDENENDSDDDENGDDDSASLDAIAPQSYRWVTLSILREDHKSSEGSTLGLSTGQRKVVKMLTDSMNEKKSTKKSTKNGRTKINDDEVNDAGDEEEEEKEEKEEKQEPTKPKSKPRAASSGSKKKPNTAATASSTSKSSTQQPSLLSFFGAPKSK